MARQGMAWRGKDRGRAGRGRAGQGKARIKENQREMIMGFVNKGIGTGADVERLMQLADRPAGSLIEHAEISAAIGNENGTKRYQTVVQAWKARLECERAILLQTERRKGYIIATADARINHAGMQLDGAARKLKRGCEIAVRTDVEQLTAEGRRGRDHYIKTIGAMLQFHQLGRAELKDEMPETKRLAGRAS
jgi:hypothetical protein